ncbi:aminoglycoside phosphotransferase family protein [Vibrio tapetis]|uniref:Aminoglycoside phosphotransferase domain-containing protein n=1 Tax=Vibrio tapetis subsp. tapetis TaxID=1671868 RepID=A0A2N8ZLX8_9VIBR|nr:aminoglycoside phosphotransferase family protein [Vibrio tapetis]SON52921.1 conserved protein of unknown function [Vibrio tapetis subsp. tapetis]
MELLQGGREDGIFKQGDHVIRPSQPWTPAVHDLLTYLEGNGFTHGPKPIALNDNQETVSFVAGDTYNYPLIGAIATKTALQSAAKMLKHYHDVTEHYLTKLNTQNIKVTDIKWMHTPKAPFEVICHGDFTPYNVALHGDEVTGVFDFDTAHPAPKRWDLAYSVYCWAPFKTHVHDKMGDLAQQIQRARWFMDAYQADTQHRKLLVESMIERLEALVAYMKTEAKNGHAAFAQNIADGHHLAYLADIRYLQANSNEITSGLMSDD